MALSTYNKKEDGVKMSVHVDDPLVIGPEGPIRVLFDWLRMRIAVEGLETFDSARGLKYLGSWIPGDNSCRIHRGDGLEDGRDARQDTHDARNPHTAPDRGRRETFGRSKTTSVSRHRGKAKRMVKYPHGRVTLRWSFAHARVRCAGQRLRQPHREPWCGFERCTREFALRTQGLVALSSPEAECCACTVGVAEATFVESLVFHWGESAEIQHFVDNSGVITLGRRIGLGGMRHVETR